MKKHTEYAVFVKFFIYSVQITRTFELTKVNVDMWYTQKMFVS